mgnify:CR=1 FL=1|jgi:DNA repair protein SbcD/Mre11
MITLVWRTDAHLAEQAPESRTDDWAETILDKLVQVGEIASEVDADAVIDGGDFFHIKMPSRTPHKLIQRIAEVHANYPCPVYGTIGNHDVKYGDLDFLKESPLGVLFSTGVFKRLDENEGTVFQPMPREAGRRLTMKVRVVAVPYHGKSYDMNRLTTITKGSEDYLVVVAHLLASQAGGEMFGAEDIVRYSDIANLDPDVWCFGHWHKNQGVAELGGKHFVNVGSLSRGALSEDELKRVPEVVVMRFDEEGIRIERRPLAVRPAAEVFDLETRVRQQARTMTVDAFVDSVKETFCTQDRKPLFDEIRDTDMPDEVRERVLSYLEAQGGS